MKTKKIHKTVTTYPLGDFLIRIKNSVMAGNKILEAPSTKVIHEVAKTMKKMGYLVDVTKKDDVLSIALAYSNKKPVIMDLKLISRPGYRRYISVGELESFRGPEKYILSTPKGILSSSEAIKTRSGGELIVKIL